VANETERGKDAYSVLLQDDNIAQIARQVRICLSRVRSVSCQDIDRDLVF
jgi:hypothetical protein